jgi:hypothetical protein
MLLICTCLSVFISSFECNVNFLILWIGLFSVILSDLTFLTLTSLQAIT